VIQSFLSTAHGGSLLPLDTGDVDHDLRSWLHGQTAMVTDPQNASLILALTAAASENPDDADTLYL
jgi:hypothetical protein